MYGIFPMTETDPPITTQLLTTAARENTFAATTALYEPQSSSVVPDTTLVTSPAGPLEARDTTLARFETTYYDDVITTEFPTTLGKIQGE